MKYCLSPQDVYTDPAVRNHIVNAVLVNWAVVAFRPVQTGEWYINGGGEIEEHCGTNYMLGNGPRLIIVRKEPSQPLFTEIKIPERRITMRNVYGCEASEVVRQAETLGYEVIGFRHPLPGEITLSWNSDSYGRPNGLITQTNERPWAPELQQLKPYRQQLLVTGHCDGVRAIVRKKQADINPFA